MIDVSALINSTRKVRREYRRSANNDRAFIIDSLYGAGFSLRAIANLLGVSLYQVRLLGSAFADPKRYVWPADVWGTAA